MGKMHMHVCNHKSSEFSNCFILNENILYMHVVLLNVKYVYSDEFASRNYDSKRFMSEIKDNK